MEAGRRTLPGVPKYLYGMSVPSRASRAGRLPCASSAHRAVCPPPASCLWQTLSVGWPEVPPEAGAGGWQQGSGERWPAWVAHPVRPFRPSVGAGCRYQARLACSVGDGGQGPQGAEGLQAAVHQQQVPQRPTAPICCHLGWEGFFVFVFVFSCLSFVLFSSCLFQRELRVSRGLLTPSNFPPEMQAGTVTLGLHR